MGGKTESLVNGRGYLFAFANHLMRVKHTTSYTHFTMSLNLTF